MTTGEIVTTALSVASILFGVFVSRSLALRDKKDENTSSLLSTLGEMVTILSEKIKVLEKHETKLSQFNNEVIAMDQRLKQLEKEVTSFNIRDVSYEARKSLDSANRTHQRIDDIQKDITQIKDNLVIHEKATLKLTLLVEAVQERLKA